MAKPAILVVEDDVDILRLVTYNLETSGFDVATAQDGYEALALARRRVPDLIILDLMLPGLDGLEVCKELKRSDSTRKIPVLMLTARAEEVDRIVGLELGADDYVTKPFGLRELLARVRVCLRRQLVPAEITRYRFGDVEIDFEKYRTVVRNKPLELTQKEYDLIRFMIRNRDTVLTRDRLLDEVWGYDSYPTTRTVDTHILKLRKKLEKDPANPKYILSVYGGGYKFVG